jgi:hypothetical protein
MKKQLTLAALACVCAAVFYECSSCEKKHEEKNVISDVQPDTHCLHAPASWFAQASTPAPDDYGPFADTTTTTDCDFHLWSWQKFLSLTRSADGKAPFQSLVQVSNDLDPLGPVLQLSDVTQAGTHGTLYDKTNTPIYYSIYVNQQMYDFQKLYLPQFAGHIDSLQKYHLDTLSFPVGCFEVKASWIMATSLSSAELPNYYTTNAVFRAAPDVMPETLKVALLGMHIVAKVDNHPELVWATFEHDAMAPDYNWATGKDTVSKVLDSVNYLFYNANTPINQCPMNNSQGNPATPQFSSIYNMFPLGMAESFTAANLPSKKDLANNANIQAINASVSTQLQKTSGPWSHYFYKGALWLDDPVAPGFGPGKGYLGNLTNPFLRGSRALSNITMETFAQVNFSGNFASGSMNCFGCHGTADYRNAPPNDSVSYNLALSHLFINALIHKLHPETAKTP